MSVFNVLCSKVYSYGMLQCCHPPRLTGMVAKCFRSIARTANVSAAQIRSAASSTTIELDSAKEWKLAKLVLRFSEIIDRCVADLTPHTLCDYLYELATIFTEFYDVCYVVEKDRLTGKVMLRLVLASSHPSLPSSPCEFILLISPQSYCSSENSGPSI